jgi:hypothetical protein
MSAFGGKADIDLASLWRNSPVTEAQENPAALDGVRDGLLDLIYGIGRGNRLANAAGPDLLDQLA